MATLLDLRFLEDCYPRPLAPPQALVPADHLELRGIPQESPHSTQHPATVLGGIMRL